MNDDARQRKDDELVARRCQAVADSVTRAACSRASCATTCRPEPGGM